MREKDRLAKVDMGERGVYDKRNKLNHLTNKEWMKFTRSWFVHYPNKRKEDVMLHPAKYPESLVKEFVEFFTKEGEMVLDPFLGTGSTLVACEEINRKGIGIELIKKYADIAKERLKGDSQKVILGDVKKLKDMNLPKIDFVMTSPPYGPMLNKEIGEIVKTRTKEKLDLKYSEEDEDIGNVKDYDEFVDTLCGVFRDVKDVLRKKGYLVIVVQNYRDKGKLRTLAWDIAKGLEEDYALIGEKIWCQHNKQLLPYGYRYGFIPNIHHHYCLIFQNIK